jgi:predicted glycoside hydrolase/deacetylase ChbG (UPF0249 family)
MAEYYFKADDFGYNQGVNEEIIRLYKAKKLKSFSVLVDFFNKSSDLKYKTFLKNKNVSLHVNLIEGKNYDSLPIFVFKLLFSSINLKEIEREIQRQIDSLARLNVNIIELNSHQHIHALSPISELFISLAKKNKITKIRSYQNLKAQTLRGKLCYLLLKTASILSHFRYKGGFDLPETWKLKGNDQYYMSWEDNNFSPDKLNQNTDIIIHPGSKFDKNNNYFKYL